MFLQKFDGVFSAIIEEYKASLSGGRNSRSSTVSSVLSLQHSDQHGNTTASNSDKQSAVTDQTHSQIPHIATGDKTDGATGVCDDITGDLSDNTTNHVSDSLPQPYNVVNQSENNNSMHKYIQQGTAAVQNTLNMTTQTSHADEAQSSVTLTEAYNDSPAVHTPAGLKDSPVVSSIIRNDSSKSLTSITSSLATNSTRRGSITSMSSFDQSEDFSDNRKLTRRRKLRAATITFTSPEKDGDLSDGESSACFFVNCKCREIYWEFKGLVICLYGDSALKAPYLYLPCPLPGLVVRVL